MQVKYVLFTWGFKYFLKSDPDQCLCSRYLLKLLLLYLLSRYSGWLTQLFWRIFLSDCVCTASMGPNVLNNNNNKKNLNYSKKNKTKQKTEKQKNPKKFPFFLLLTEDVFWGYIPQRNLRVSNRTV